MVVDVSSPRDVRKHVSTLTMENGLALHSWVIGLPYFVVNENSDEGNLLSRGWKLRSHSRHSEWPILEMNLPAFV